MHVLNMDEDSLLHREALGPLRTGCKKARAKKNELVCSVQIMAALAHYGRINLSRLKFGSPMR